jgi:hypothetical protein
VDSDGAHLTLGTEGHFYRNALCRGLL